MLKKLSRSFERKREGKTAVKFKFDVRVVKLIGSLPTGNAIRILWTRGSKVQMTKGVAVGGSEIPFEVTLSQVATLYKDARNQFDAKEYVFAVQTVGGEKSTIGKGVLDLSQFASFVDAEREVVVPLIGKKAKGMELHLVVMGVMLKGISGDDGMSTVSGLSAMTSSVRSATIDQDLSVIPYAKTVGGPPVDDGRVDGVGFYGDVYSSESGTMISAVSDLCNSCSHSDNSYDSTIGHDRLSSQSEAVSHLQSKITTLEAELKAQVSENDDLKRQIESHKRQAQNDVSFMRKEVESLRLQKTELENQLVKEVDESIGHLEMEEALKSAIAPYEMRYVALMEEYQEMMQQCHAEIDGLQQELLASKDQTAKLTNLLEVSERARENLNVEKRALEMSLIGSCSEQADMDKERRELRQELVHVDEVMQELIQTKIRFAELSEKQTITKREMLKMKERNLQLASKITKMETYLYYKESQPM